MKAHRFLLPVLALSILVGMAGSAPAQVLGTFRWQLQPYCNVVTLVVTQVGGVFRLEGTDDRCGAATQSSAVGTAFVNPDGSIGFGLTVVTGPGGVAFPVDATVGLPSASGTWRDALGHSGSFVLTPGAGTGGSPRPLTGSGGSITVSALRAGSGVVAAPVAPGSAEVEVGLDFGGSGASSQVARADHTHEAPGVANTSVGALALPINIGNDNSAMGLLALNRNTRGSSNTSMGSLSLMNNTTGNANTALGTYALFDNTTGSHNVALGDGALRNNTAGAHNTAIGGFAGAGLTIGNGNIYVGSRAGSADESDVIRIGYAHSATYIQGIYGATASGGLAVFVDSGGRLGTLPSSVRYKKDVTGVGESVSSLLQALRPVRFVYKPAFDDGAWLPQYGLIAEEVAEVFPELAARDAAGRPETVRYQFLPPLLLAEVQRLERERTAQAAKLAAQAAEIGALRDELAALRTSLERVIGATCR